MSEKLSKPLLASVWLTQATDTGSTLYALNLMGNELKEGNSTIQSILDTDHIGPVGFEGMGDYVLFPLAKVVSTLLLVGVAKVGGEVGNTVLLGGSVLGGYVAANNLLLIYKYL